MAKKCTQDQDGRLPYDHQEAKRWVEAAAEALRVKRWNLTYCAMCVYGRTQPGFAAKAAATGTLNHRDENLRRVLTAGHQQWTRQTGLPPLDSDVHWRIVAVAAGASDESLRAIEAGNRKGLELLVERIAAWCKQRQTSVPTAPADEPGIDDPLPLDAIEVKILRRLVSSVGVVLTQEDLMARDAANADRKTVGNRLNRLMGDDVGYVKRPKGRKRGYVITSRGVERLRLLDAAETSR